MRYVGIVLVLLSLPVFIAILQNDRNLPREAPTATAANAKPIPAINSLERLPASNMARSGRVTKWRTMPSRF